jgi:Phytanoyl-CoA dioxygenase (PhyH)
MVDPEFKRALLEDGVAIQRGALTPPLLEALQTCFDWSYANPGPIALGLEAGAPQGDNWRDYHNPEAIERYIDTIRSLPFAAVVKDVWDCEHIWYHGEETFLKRGVAGRTAWHQDTPYVPWDGEHWVNCWISFDALPKGRAIEVVRGSHRGPKYEDAFGVYKGDAAKQAGVSESGRPFLPDIEAGRDTDNSPWDIVSFDIEPGDVVFFHPGSLHSGPPTGDLVQLRRTLVLRFFGDKAYWTDEPEAPGLSEVEIEILYGKTRGTPGESFRDERCPLVI